MKLIEDYKAPKWDEIYLDALYLQIPPIAGRDFKDLPSHIALQVHAGFQEREAQKANNLNYAAAILADMKAAQAEKRKQLNPEKWLPFDLNKDKRITPELSDLVLRLVEEKRLPVRMVADLSSTGVLGEMREQIGKE